MQQVTELETGLAYELTGPFAIQATGSVQRREFYFHAKHSNWTFEMADDLGHLPSDTGNNPVFTVAGRWKYADEMTPLDAQRIITGCARLFLVTAANHL